MESPVVVDKPPEYHGTNDRGFPFEEEEGSGAWSELAARHPDIAARLRQRPATWARKRRPSSQDATDDFGDSFSGFDRFPFDDIPSEFREHFPTHWNRRFSSREEPQPQTPSSPQQTQPPQQHTAATQTEQIPGPSDQEQAHLPQYGLRNTVDLGQKSPADPSLVDAEERNQRSMSAPPDNRTEQNCATNKMNSQQNHHEPPHPTEQASNVRHIPIFVEGRDEPVINKSVDHGTHFGDTKPTTYPPPPPQPHIEREQYFPDDVPFHHPPNFSRAFGTPFNKGFRQGPQPFVQQKVYPQTAFARGASPQRSQSPKPPPQQEEQFVKVPVHHEQAAPKPEPAARTQRPAPSPTQHAPPAPHAPPQREQTPEPPKPQPPPSNDPITQILSIQTDVLNLMTEVENFTGTKKDKRYLFLDEMLTRNLIKLDTIETEGKENIRLARKEAIRCIQKCIAVLEAKAENRSLNTPQPQDAEMNEKVENIDNVTEPVTENGEVEMKEAPKDEANQETQTVQPQEQNQKPHEESAEVTAPPPETKETTPQAADTRPEEKVPEQQPEVPPAPQPEQPPQEEQNNDNVEKKPSAKKGTKVVKKRDKSKDKKEAANDSNKETKSNEEKKDKEEVMQVDKGDRTESQMEVDGAASQ